MPDYTYSPPTNGLWLAVLNLTNNTLFADLNGATDYVYEVFSRTNLPPTEVASNWNIETELFPDGTNVVPFSVPMNGRNPLFLWARDWTGITSHGNTAPEWWLWLWRTNIDLSDADLDFEGHTLLYDYNHRYDPNLQLSIAPPNQIVTQGSNATFSVTNEGAALVSYQWYWNGAPLSDDDGVSGTASASLSLNGVQPYQAGNYYVVGANVSGSNISAYAALTVVPPQSYDTPPLYLMPPYAYWNVTDISDPGQPVNIGELQEPFTEPSYDTTSIPPINTLWHTSASTTVTEAYGTTSSGGVSNNGTVFKIGANGPEGNQPSELALSGNTLYGTTPGFGYTNIYNNYGRIFSINTNGSKYTTIFGFNSAISTANGPQGNEPEAGLAVSGSTLYGTTAGGGANGYGTVFVFNNGILNNLYSFDGPENGDGELPGARLVLSSNMLYGTTEEGGADSVSSSFGTVFQIGTGGSGYQILHTFTGGDDDGMYPQGDLVLYGGVLYGTTSEGGAAGVGTVFSINLNTNNNYSVLQSFDYVDGSTPLGGLAISNGILYGTTSSYGGGGGGTIFAINLNSNNEFSVLHNFDALSTNDAANPYATLVVDGNTLYGTAKKGGLYGTGVAGYGTVFSLNVTNNYYTNLYSFQDGGDGAFPETALVLSGNTLFGTTIGDISSADDPNYGTIFSVNTDGSDFTILDTFTPSGFAVLHDFNGLDGSDPSSQLALSGSDFYNIPTTVYGTTASGGANGYGTVFKVNTSGSGFADLYDFGGTNDGKYPQLGLLISANTLYGATSNSIFKINTDGSDFICLTNVIGASQLLLSVSGATLYGAISNGGAHGYGSIFSINTDGTGFTNFHSFTGGAGGQYPNSGLELYSVENPIKYGGLTLFAIYGTTYSGGASNYGMVFSVTNDGSGFNDVYDFTGATDGGNPVGGLLLTNNDVLDASATYLYGIASTGGTNGGGTIFGMNLNGGSVATVYNFKTNIQPEGKLAFVGKILYGTTSGGGADTNGMVYRINNNGGGFADIYDFKGGSDGKAPLAGLALPVVDNLLSIWSLDATLNVSAQSLTNANYSVAIDNYYALFVNGDVVSYDTHNGSASWSGYSPLAPYLHPGTNNVRVIIGGDADAVDYFTMRIRSSLTNALFGTASSGGSNSDGTIFEITPNGYETNLYEFSGTPDGANPVGDMVLSGTNLFGVTENGGTNGYGEVFKIDIDGSGFANLHSFGGAANDGAFPQAGLLLSGNKLYGTAQNGGANGNGTIFRINADGSGYTNLYSFEDTVNNDGKNPEAPLLLIGTNLYGTTFSGGSNGYGTIFSICTNGSDYAEMYSFNGAPSDGSGPEGKLTVLSNTLYGTTYNGGTSGAGDANGTVFGYTMGGRNDQILHSFTNMPDGANPRGGLALSGNTLYGTTEHGGVASVGTIFSVGINGTGYTILANFDLSLDTGSGQYPDSDLLIVGDLLYGTTSQGGLNNAGMVFNIITNGTGFNDIYDFSNAPDGSLPAGGICVP